MKINMIPRIIFLIFTIGFITLTWFLTGKAKSCHAVNEQKGTCKCKAEWEVLDLNGNKENKSASYNFQGCQDDCKSYTDNDFCNNACPQGTTEDEKNTLCPGRKDRFSLVQNHTCDCPYDTAAN